MEVRPRVAAHFSYYAAVTLSQRVLGYKKIAGRKHSEPTIIISWRQTVLQGEFCRFLRRFTPICGHFAWLPWYNGSSAVFLAPEDRAGGWTCRVTANGRTKSTLTTGGLASRSRAYVTVNKYSIHPGAFASVFFIFQGKFFVKKEPDFIRFSLRAQPPLYPVSFSAAPRTSSLCGKCAYA